MGLRAAKIAPYSSASRSKQLLCCFFAYLAKIDPIDFLKPPWLCGSNRRHLWFTNTHTTSTYFYVFLMTVIFFSRSWLSSRQLMLLDLEWNCDKQFSFRSTKIWLRVRLEIKSRWRRAERDEGAKVFFFLMFLFMFPQILMDRKWPRFNLLHTLFLSK